MSVRVLVTGVTGRMGSTLVRLLSQAKGFELVGGTARAGSSIRGVDVGLASRLGSLLGVPVYEDLAAALAERTPQVVIDFTSAEASVSHARSCADRQVGMVVGSTGFDAAQRGAMKQASASIPLVLAPNTSVGVNLMIRMAGQLARALGEGFDVEVLEAHHRKKKDAPSGTALRLAEEIAAALGRSAEDFRLSRQGPIGERPANEIGVQTLRGGDVVGEHTVFYFGEGERIELTHRATNRDQFALGALRAARWVATQPAGLYDMMDVLGPLKEDVQ